MKLVSLLRSAWKRSSRGARRAHWGRPLTRREGAASDLAQSVCREALEKVADERLRFEGPAALKQWLYKAALLKVSEKRRHYLAQRRDAGREVALPTKSQGLSRAEFFRTMLTPSRRRRRARGSRSSGERLRTPDRRPAARDHDGEGRGPLAPGDRGAPRHVGGQLARDAVARARASRHAGDGRRSDEPGVSSKPDEAAGDQSIE